MDSMDSEYEIATSLMMSKMTTQTSADAVQLCVMVPGSSSSSRMVVASRSQQAHTPSNVMEDPERDSILLLNLTAAVWGVSAAMVV
jgi:hypothetical protein